MRVAILLANCVVATIGQAQDWALINPAYKYNYSNDGTDTIRHQIKVLSTEILGPDGSVYQLNRTAELCFGCWENCDLQLGIAQFMQGSCSVSGTDWQFSDPGEVHIKARASLDEQWIFHPESAALATLTSIAETTTFGVPDSVRTMVTELGDSVLWSKDHGILLWHLHDDVRYQLIGITGPDVGTIVPSVYDFFPFQAGDMIHMAVGSGQLNSLPTSTTTFRRFQIEERIETSEYIRFSGTAFQIDQYYNGQFSTPLYGPYLWEIDLLNDSTLTPFQSAPQEFIELGHPLSSISATPMQQLVVQHYRDQDGHYVIESTPGVAGTVFTGVNGALDACVTVTTCPMGTEYRVDTELGLREVALCAYPYYHTFNTFGAIIAGDTIGTIYEDAFYHVGQQESSTEQFLILANVANESVQVLKGPMNTSQWRIAALDGKWIRQGLMVSGNSGHINVADLPSGIYILELVGEAHVRQRFVVRH